MTIQNQRTIQAPVSWKGIGLHSGAPVHLTVEPERPNRGIRFVRTDLPGQPEIEAHYRNVVNTQLATTLGRPGSAGVTLSTVEHLLSALGLLEIDNARILIDGPELPIVDGSCIEFLKALQEVGILEQKQPRAVLAIRKRIELKVNEKWAVVEPSSRFEIEASIDWEHPMIGYQEFRFVAGETTPEEIASARTFGFAKDVEALKRMGLARGGSLDNAVVLDDALVLNPSGLRFVDEFVRHKILDAVGDFKLAGLPILGSFRLHRSGHDLHRQLLQEIFSNPDHYEIIEGVLPVRPARLSRSVVAAAGVGAASSGLPRRVAAVGR